MCMLTAFISGTEGDVSSAANVEFVTPYFLCGTRYRQAIDQKGKNSEWKRALTMGHMSSQEPLRFH